MKVIDLARKFAPIFGVVLSVVVIGLLIYLHVFATPTVPKPRSQSNSTPNVIVCDGDVPWVTDDTVNVARTFWNAHGYTMGPTVRQSCATLRQCTTDGRMVPCSPGNIVVSLRDKWFSEDHAGETLAVSDKTSGDTQWATILLPSKIIAPDNINAPPLPLDVENLVFAHEVGHWFGFDHVETRIAGPFIAEPTGHLMTKSVFKQGWGDAGLSR